MHFDIVGLESPCVDLNINVENFPRQTEESGSWRAAGRAAARWLRE